VWHPRLVQVQTQLLDTIWEPADVVYVVVCGPSGVGKSKLAEVLTRRLNMPKSASNEHALRRALLVNTRPPDGELFHRTNFYQQGLRLLVGQLAIEYPLTREAPEPPKRRKRARSRRLRRLPFQTKGVGLLFHPATVCSNQSMTCWAFCGC